MNNPEQDLRDLVALGREQRGVEFKSGGPRTSAPLFGKVLRAMIAMSNRRDGGRVILGFKDDDYSVDVTGVPVADVPTWNHDHLSDGLSQYVTPAIQFDVNPVPYDALTCIVIRVFEFEDIPVICSKPFSTDGKLIVRQGACYVRPRHKVESAEITTYIDMKDLLDLCIDKGVRAYVARLARAGLWPTSSTNQAKTPDTAFDDELGDLLK